MKKSHLFLFFLGLLSLSFLLSSCYREDIGTYQEEIRTIDLRDFNKLQMGSAFLIKVQQGSDYSIIVKGDRRNLDDLEVYVSNSTFKAGYKNNRNQQYATEFLITMPDLSAVNFSGASKSEISRFSRNDKISIKLSGASGLLANLEAGQIDVVLSGASDLQFAGNTSLLKAEISGASLLKAFDLPTTEARVEVSGASNARINVSDIFYADVSGASSVRYRGNPSLKNFKTSGASSIQQD